jgi:hypothetical protein
VRGARLLVLAIPLVAAACGGHSATPSSASSATASQAAFKATLIAPTHHPKVNVPWIYEIRVTDAAGHPIRAHVHIQILFGSSPVGQVGTHDFVGVWKEPKNAPLKWPAASKGHPLVFEAIVTARGQTKKIDYPIEVE